jgi:hypothetical protein
MIKNEVKAKGRTVDINEKRTDIRNGSATKSLN